MKRRFFKLQRIMLLAIVAMLGLNACQKAETDDKINESSMSTIDQLKKINASYVSSNNNLNSLAKKSLLNFAADDAMGALAGAGWGSIAGPFGSFCLGASMCCYMSVRDMYPVADPPVNPTENEPKISENPYDFMGYIHNKTLLYILNNRDHFFQNGEINTQTYLDSSKKYFKTFSELSDFELEDQNFDTHLALLYSIYNGNISQGYESLVSTQVITENTGNIMQSFWNTASAIELDADRRSYYISYVNIINSSNDLSENEKRIILSASSVTIYSLLFHNANSDSY